MGCFSGPDGIENGLVLALDAANQKSLNIPSQAEHGYADWYCFISGTATYSIINSTGGVIYERNGSTITTLVTATSPQRGTISVVAGRTYYGSVPINLVVEDQHHWIAPLTMMGTQFIWWTARSTPGTCYLYSPYQNATVKFWNNPTSGGITSTTITNTLSVTSGIQTSFTFTTPVNFEASYTHYMSSDVPILATTTQSGTDKTILSPTSKTVYQRYINYNSTVIQTTPSSIQNGCVSDSTNFVMTQNIADGSGGDCAQGLGLEYLSDTYSWGNVVSDYVISCPYNGTVTASYWNGSSWVVLESHTITGATTTIPIVISRDGWTGVGMAATTINGTAANMASGAALWKWEGTSPFYLCINDSSDDEFSVLGYLSSRQTTPRSSNIITDLSGNSNNGTLVNYPTYSSANGGSLVFDGSSYNNINIPFNASKMDFSLAQTICMWLRPATGSNTQRRNPYNQAYGGPGTLTYETDATITYYFGTNGGNDFPYVGRSSGFTIAANETSFISVARNQVTNVCNWYKNGILITTSNAGGYAATANGSSPILIGIGYMFPFLGNIYDIKVYNRALTASEVQQNFNALRGRFGI